MKCQNCGYDSNMSFCPNCGAKLENEFAVQQKLSEIPPIDLSANKENPSELKKGLSKDKKIILSVVAAAVVILLISGIAWGSCAPKSSSKTSSKKQTKSAVSEIETQNSEFSVCGITLSAPSDWSLERSETNEENTCYFYPDDENAVMFMVSRGDTGSDFDLTQNYVVDSLIEGFFKNDSYSEVKEVERVELEIGGNDAVRLDFKHKIDDMQVYSSVYFTIYNSRLFAFDFVSNGKKPCSEFTDYQDDVIKSIVFDYEEPPIEYEEVSTKKLYENYEDYDEEYITTTLKITKADSEYDIYTYRVYELDGFDKVEISASFSPDKKIKKGDYITVSGYCSVEDDGDELYISISQIEQSDKVKKKLFKKIGGSEKKPTIFSEGQYKVGKDITAGTYVAYPTKFSYSGYYCISSDANGDDIIANNIFKGQSYLTVSNGQYLELSKCMLRPVSEKEKVDYSDGYLYEGQYIVGRDVPAGEYKLIPTEENYSGYYALTADANSDNIISNDNFKNERYVTISNGQFLELSRCKMKIK